jgi:hypothetical protein
VMSLASVFSMLRLASASSPIRQKVNGIRILLKHEQASVLTEEAASIHVRRQEVAVTGHGTLWCEARHVGRLHDVFQVVSRIAVWSTMKLDQICN